MYEGAHSPWLAPGWGFLNRVDFEYYLLWPYPGTIFPWETLPAMFYSYIIGANFSQQQSSLDHSGMQNDNVTIHGGRPCLIFHLDAGKVEPK